MKLAPKFLWPIFSILKSTMNDDNESDTLPWWNPIFRRKIEVTCKGLHARRERDIARDQITSYTTSSRRVKEWDLEKNNTRKKIMILICRMTYHLKDGGYICWILSAKISWCAVKIFCCMAFMNFVEIVIRGRKNRVKLRSGNFHSSRWYCTCFLT